MNHGASDIVASLPSEPLPIKVGEKLASQETDEYWVRPESILIRRGDEVVVSLSVIFKEANKRILVGYSPDVKGWSVLDQWTEDELDEDEFCRSLEEWEDEMFGDRPEFHF